jgi:LuxR family maltose regulon positive regulatory protein
MIGIAGRFAMCRELDFQRRWVSRRSARTSKILPRRRPAGSAQSNGSPCARRAVRGRWSPNRGVERAVLASARHSITRRTILPVPDALARALRDAPLVVVQAPAGFGKTTATRAALGDAGDLAWYDAQPWEADAFVAALLARVREVRPDVGRLTLALAEQGADPERLGATFAEELRHVDVPLRVVIDDAHLLGESFSAFARSLVRRMPEAVRVVLLTRAALDIGLPESIAAGRGALIDATALRFDTDDARALAGELGVTLDEPRARELVQRTEGWPIAVALALRAPDASETLLDDLVRRRLAALGDEQRALVFETVAYETIEPDVAAPGDARFARHLAELAGDAALVTRTSSSFRVQPLVRDLVARELGAGALAARHATAAAAYARARRLRPALFHLERAHDPSADAAFLRVHAAPAIESGLVDGVRTSLARLRFAGIDEPALLAYLDGIVLKARGVDGRPAFAIAAREAGARADGALAFEAHLAGIEADLARGDAVEAERIDDLLVRAASIGAQAVAKAHVRAGWADAIAGRFTRALERIEAFDSADPALLADYARIALGDFEAGERIATALIEAWSNGDDLLRYAGALVWAARFALLRGDTSAAYELGREAERISRPFAIRPQAAALHGTLAEAALFAGDTALARHEARAALRSADTAWYARDAARTRSLAARILARADALDGDLDAARRAAAVFDAGDALGATDRALYATAAHDPSATALRASARAAIAAATPVDAADAVWLWSAATFVEGLGERAGAAQPNFGPFTALVVRRDEDRSRTFEAHLLERSAGPRAINRPFETSPEIETLTPREAEILTLLAAGLTNREIAQRLILSARTVETHVARVTGKLGVNSRARAVARAVALGLVNPAVAAV